MVRLVAALLFLGGLFIDVVCVTMFFVKPRPIELRCDRALGACVLDNGVTKRSFPLAEITTVKARRDWNRGQGASWTFYLERRDGESVPFCDAPEYADVTRRYQEMAEPVRAFFAGGPAATASIECHEGIARWSEKLWYLFWGLLMTIGGFLVWRAPRGSAGPEAGQSSTK